jgi:BolA protein
LSLSVDLTETIDSGEWVEPEHRKSAIENALEERLEAAYVRVVDHSTAHAGHPGASSGAGHFEVTVVSAQFAGLTRVAAQRLVYQALGGLMESDIHALTMRLFTPQQWRDQSSG